MERVAETGTPRGRICSLALALFCLACGAEAAEQGALRVDSAGTQIVTSLHPTWVEETKWVVAPAPIWEVGTGEAAADEFFERITDIAVGPDGRTAVADAYVPSVRIFDRAGRLQRTLGRQGEGPGEFEWVTSVWWTDAGDLAIYDDRLGRLTTFDVEREVLSTLPVLLPPGRPATDVLEHSNDGVLAVKAGPVAGTEGDAVGLVTSPARVLRLAPDSDVLDTIVTVPGDEFFLLRSATGRFAGFYLPLFGLRHAFALHEGEIYTRRSRDREIAVYDEMGGLRRVLRWGLADLTVDEKRRAEALEFWASQVGEEVRYELPMPEAAPGFGRILFDELGYLWASEYEQHGEDARRWFILRPTGEYLGTIDVPDGFRPFVIEEDRILGRYVDALGVESVRVLSLER